MNWVLRFLRSSIGLKLVMALSGVVLFGFVDVIGTDLDTGFKEVLIPQVRAMGGDGAINVRFRQTQYLPVTRVFGAIFFPHRSSRGPAVRRIRPADAAVRLYACSLNALAHPEDGLPSAVRLATSLPAFEVHTSNLSRAAAGIAAVLAREAKRRRRAR